MPYEKDEADRQQENKVEQTENVGDEEKKTEGKDAGQVYYASVAYLQLLLSAKP